MCLLSYVIRCHVHSDAIENRFGWYRQFSSNYFNSVLPFLQSEKTIRIRSLIKTGFRISGVKEIFDGAVTEAQNEISFEVDHLIDAMDDIEFNMDLSFSSNDGNSTIFYVAVAVRRSLLKKLPKNHHECCSSMILHRTSFKLTEDENVGALSDLQAKNFFIDCVQRWLTASF